VDLRLRPDIPSHFRTSNDAIATVIENSWEFDPTKRPSFTQIIDILTSTLLSSVLKDNDAIQMWKQNFSDKDNVPLNEFYEALWQRVLEKPCPKPEEDDTQLKCIEAIVKGNTTKPETISLERFGLLLHWYGPLCPIGSKPNMLCKIEELLRKSWYHGEISGQEAEELLNRYDSEKMKGDFLIRCSLNPSAPFTISRFEGHGSTRTIVHHRISYNRTTMTYKMQFQAKKTDELKEIKGDTLDEFVADAKNRLGMKKAITCTKFLTLFIDGHAGSNSYRVAMQ